MNRETGEPANVDGGAKRPDNDRFYRETGLASEIARIAEPVLEGLGFRLVRVQISGQAGGKEGQIIQIMAERPDGSMTITDCETVSRDVSAVLDSLDPVRSAYRLEVSSPGIDRPLVRPSDFDDWAGHEARIELKELVSGRKRWRGELEGIEDGEVRVVCDIEGQGLQTVGFPIALIAEAKLMLTDDLVREALRSSKRGEEAVDDGQEAPGNGAKDRQKRARKPAAKKHPGTV